VVLAAALLGFFAAIGLRGSMIGLVLSHTIIACPLAFWILQAGFAEQSIQLERAAIVLGARPLKAFLSITLRLALPAVVAAGMFAFIAAFDDVPIALFLSSPTLVTLPVRIYNFVDQSLTPVVVAASSLLIFIVCIVVAVVDRTVGLARAFGVKEMR
jgi:putative spermidine/putrescine transport system permease protein